MATDPPLILPSHPNLAISLFVFAGPGLRTSLLGSLLVAEAAIGLAYGLSDPGLALLMESVVCGALVAMLLLPTLTARVGTRRLSLAAAVAVLVMLIATLVGAPSLTRGLVATGLLFGGAAMLGFASAMLAAVTQGLLCQVSATDPQSRHLLQSVWSAGQPAGFIVGSIAGGFLVTSLGWWGAFALPLTLALLIVAPVALDRHLAEALAADDAQGSRTAPAVRELLWLLVAAAAFEVWSTFGSLVSWTSWVTNLALLVTVIAVGLAVQRLRRQGPAAAIPATPFLITGFAAAAIVLLLLQLPTTAEFEVLLLTDLAGTSPEILGDRSALGNLGQILGTSLAGLLLYRQRSKLALFGGLSILCVGLVAYIAYPWMSAVLFIHGSRAIVGFGAGLATPVLFVLALARMPAELSIPAGTWLVLTLIGGTEIGLAVFDLVLSAATVSTGSPFVGYVVVEAAQAATGVGVLIVAVFLLGKPRPALAIGVPGKA